MILLTDDLRDRLLANGWQRDVDHVPVVRSFNPVGAGTWQATETDVLGRIADHSISRIDELLPSRYARHSWVQ